MSDKKTVEKIKDHAMMMSKIETICMGETKNCPFCGGESEASTVERFDDVWKVVCFNPGCGAEVGNFNTRERALEAWNRRAGDDL